MNIFALKQENQIAVKQSQHLLLSLAMQQAFHVLQMPILELAEWMKLEIEKNPVLEIDLTQDREKETLDELSVEDEEGNASEYCDSATEELEKKRKAYQESLFSYPISLYEHLMVQARFAFDQPEDLSAAELLIGHLDQRGFLTTALDQISSPVSDVRLAQLLSVIQTFDPPGIAAFNLRESLLLQLRLKHKENSLAYQIVQNHFEDLIHNRLSVISKKCGLAQKTLQEIIQTDVTPLDIHPGYHFQDEYACPIIPDVQIDYQEEEWLIQINQTRLPRFQIAPVYDQALRESRLEKEELLFVRRHCANGRWLKKIVSRRQDTLRAIATYLIKTQSLFLSGEQKTLQPITLQEMAQELGMHESTAARAVANKYLSCPQGTFSLRSFFTHGVRCANGQKVSNHTLRQLLLQMVDREDKTRPLSDAAIAGKFKKMGIPCARRTVAKYREHLQIGPSARRRKWK